MTQREKKAMVLDSKNPDRRVRDKVQIQEGLPGGPPQIKTKKGWKSIVRK